MLYFIVIDLIVQVMLEPKGAMEESNPNCVDQSILR